VAEKRRKNMAWLLQRRQPKNKYFYTTNGIDKGKVRVSKSPTLTEA
jgi:hypothetical protein